MKPHSTRRWFCSPCNTAAAKEWAANNPERVALNSKRFRAKRKGIEFALEMEDLEWPTHCPILGIKLRYHGGRSGSRYDSASFDRLDPSKGYVKGNVTIISNRANMIKNCGTAEEHRAIADWMDAQNNKKQQR